MKYLYNDNGTKIEVEPERWVWGVIYNDETELHQFEAPANKDSDGIFHRVGEIDQDRVKMAVLYKYNDPKKRIDLPWQPGMKLIHKYRNIQPYYKDHFVKIYMFGYKLGNQSHFTFILPDDRIILSPEDNVDLIQFSL